MQSRRKYLKLAAFVPALVLVGGFIGYRAGAFELPWLSKPAPPPEVQPDPQPTAAQPPANSEPTFLPGSKSLSNLGVGRSGVKPPHDPANPPPGSVPPTPEKPPAFLPGSKSDAGLLVPDLIGSPKP